MADELTQIGELAKHGWWVPVLGVAALVLSRNELIKMLLAPKSDRALEAAMARMVGLFEQNLNHFEQANRGIEDMTDQLKEQVRILHKIVEELVRGNHTK